MKIPQAVREVIDKGPLAHHADDVEPTQTRVGAWIGRWLRLLVRLAYQWTRAEAGMPSLAIRFEHVAPDFCLGLLIGQSSGLKPPADDGLVAKHRCFNQTPSVVT